MVPIGYTDVEVSFVLFARFSLREQGAMLLFKRCFALAFLAGLLVFSQIAVGGVVSPIQADTDMTTGIPSSYIAATVDGSGFVDSLGNGTYPVHQNTEPSNAWLSTSGILTGNIYFTLSGVTDIRAIWFWNQNSGDADNMALPGTRSAGETGLNEVELWYANDGLAIDAMSANYTYLGNVHFLKVTASTTPLEVVGIDAIDPSLGGITANYIKFVVISNHGDTEQSGFAEVAFFEAVVPEPATWMVFAGLTIVGLGRRWRGMVRS